MTVHWELAYGWKGVMALATGLLYPLLAANVTGDDRSIFAPFRIVERAGVRIGIIGLSAVVGTQLLPMEDRGPVRLTIGDQAVNALVQRLRHEHRVELVVVLSHLGFPQDCKLAAAASANVPIALSNGWRYGAPIPAGPISEMDVWNIVPANPPVSVSTLTGAELRNVSEQNLEATFASDPWNQRGGYVKRCRGVELAIKLENPPGERIQEMRVGGTRLRASASYKVAFLGEQAVPADFGADRQSTGVGAVDALKQYLVSRDVVESELVGSVTLV